MKKPAKRILSLAAATSLVAASTTGLAYADIENYYLKDTANDVVYEYSLQGLIDSINGDGLLYSNFGEKSQSLTMYSVYDSVSEKYIEFQELVDAYNSGVEDLNEFTSTYDGENTEMPDTVKAVTVEGGAIVETDKEVSVGVTVVSASAIDATTIEVTLSNDETDTVTLETALEDGATTVTFTYNDEVYTDFELDAPWEAPDTEAPVISVNGDTTINVENGADLPEIVVTVTDNKDETVEYTSVITDAEGNVLEAIDTTVAGTYTITYSAADEAGNEATPVVVTVNVAEYVDDVAPEAPTVDVVAGTYAAAQTVTITAEEGATVYYTVDGTEPTVESTEYTEAITVDASMTVKAIAVDAAGNVSEVMEAAYIIDATAPVVALDASVNVTADQQKLTFTVTDENVTADDITVKQGETELTVTAEETANTYSVLLNEVQGASQTLTIDATDAAGNAATQASATLVDKTKPTIESVQALNNKTLLVTFSEPVADATLTPGTIATSTKYSLYNKVNGAETKLTSAGGESATGLVVDAVFANTEKTQVKFVIKATTVAGYPQGGLSNTDYIFYASSVDDKAPVANTITAASPYEFTGTLTPDESAPELLSATFNKASGAVTLVFDKTTTGAAPADDKVYFQAGDTKVLLKNAADFGGISDTNGTVAFTVDTTAGTGTLAQINALTGTIELVIEEGAFTDGSNAVAATTVEPTIDEGLILTGVTYDELTNAAVYKFNKTVDVSEITTFAGAKFNIGGVDIQDANLVFNNTQDSNELSFTLSDAKAQAVETAVRGGDLSATVANGTVQDTEATPNTNVTASSAVTMVDGTDYIKDETAPTFESATYKADTDTLELTFSEGIRATVGDFTLADIEYYVDDDGTAGLDTTTDTKIGDFADFDAALAVNDHGALQTTFRDATGAAATATDEMTTLYLQDQDGGVEELHDAIEAQIANGDIYVVIKKDAVQDPSGNTIAADTTVKATVVNVSNASDVDTTYTEATITGSTLNSFDITFKDAGNADVRMDADTVTNIANWDIYLASNKLNKIDIDKIIMGTNDVSATVILSESLTAGEDYTIDTTGLLTYAGNAGDLDGADFTEGAGANNVTPLASTGIDLADNNTNGALDAGDTITITFNEEVKVADTVTMADIALDNSHTFGNSTFALSDDYKDLVITIGSTSTAAIGDTVTFPAGMTDLEEAEDLSGDVGQTIAAPSTATAPKIKSAVYADTNADGAVSTGDTLVVTFDQVVEIATGSTAADLVDDIIEGGSDFTAATLNGDTLTLTVGTAAFAVGDNVDVHGTPANVDIVNVWGTKAVPTVKAVTSEDTTAPTVTGISYEAANNALTFTFSEAVHTVTNTDADGLAAALAADLTVNTGADLGAAFTAATLSSDNMSVTITLDGAEAIDQYTTISINAGTFGTADKNIQDASGNIAVRGQGTPYAVTIVE